MQASHYNSIFYKDPQQFDPFRWADKEPLPFTLAGFEEGSRGCPGKSLAIMVAKIATALLLLRYDKMELVAGSPV